MTTAACADDATKIIEQTKPDLITLDIHMPGMNGVEYLKSYLNKKNIPVVMISSVSIKEGPLVMEALSSGAATYIQKPSIDEIDKLKKDVIDQLEAIATIKKSMPESRTGPVLSSFKFNTLEPLIAIGSSTGGTQALQSIFTALPEEIPPIVVTQHIPAVFSKALADRLNTLCKFNVKEAENGELIEKNNIYIAPGGKQMKIEKQGASLYIVVNDDPPLNRLQPSVDYLFNSISEIKRIKVVAAILTGMGKDGAKGMLNLKKTGAYTIAQDEKTSIVYGMPKEAIALNAQCEIKGLDEIPLALANAADRFKKVA